MFFNFVLLIYRLKYKESFMEKMKKFSKVLKGEVNIDKKRTCY